LWTTRSNTKECLPIVPLTVVLREEGLKPPNLRQRLRFSGSRHLHAAKWSDNENLAVFGPETKARHGSGRNYAAYFVFTGPVDPATGMLINISEIKERSSRIVRQRFDHKFLNADNPSFCDVLPTAENIARQLYVDVAPLFS